MRKSGLTALYALIVALVLFFGVREAQAPPSYEALAYGFITHNNNVRQAILTEGKRLDDVKRANELTAVLAERSRQKAIAIAEAKRKASEAVAEAKRKQAVAIAEVKRKQQAQPTPSRSSAPKVSAVSYSATAYVALCDSGCSGITYAGDDATQSIYYDGYRIIAADLSVLPINTIVRITTNSTSFKAIVRDSGGGINGYEVDILVDNVSKAWEFGRQKVSVEILRRGDGN